jgi:hypothetical protein
MTLSEIKQALNEGKRVFHHHKGYEVFTGFYPDGEQYWNITCLQNDHTIGLTWRNGVTMNGKEADFFIGEI